MNLDCSEPITEPAARPPDGEATRGALETDPR